MENWRTACYLLARFLVRTGDADKKFMTFETSLPPVHDVGHKYGYRQLLRNDGQLCTNQITCYSNLPTSRFQASVAVYRPSLFCVVMQRVLVVPLTTTNILSVNNPQERRAQLPTGNTIRPQTRFFVGLTAVFSNRIQLCSAENTDSG